MFCDLIFLFEEWRRRWKEEAGRSEGGGNEGGRDDCEEKHTSGLASVQEKAK